MNVLIDTISDTLSLMAYLFITYLCLEYLEHKTSQKTKDIIIKARSSGPLIGALCGMLPQCGFSVLATNFYAARVIGIGTLLAVYLSTSDEMLPILISSLTSPMLIVMISAYKVLCAIIFGYVVYYFYNRTCYTCFDIQTFCEHEHCNCQDGIFISALTHTLQIGSFIFAVLLMLNAALSYFNLNEYMRYLQIPILGELISGIIGLIPNCSASVLLTQLYIEGYINTSTLISGSLVNGGVGLIILFKVNQNLKTNLQIAFTLYVCGVLGGIISNLFF